MRRSLVLRANPTVRQIQTLLARVERALTERGATVHRATPSEVAFRMPPPWRLAPVGWLALITKGTATLSAWGGGPWRVSYRLQFTALQAFTTVVTLIIATIGWGWPRLALLSTVLVLWLAGYVTLHLVASRAFRKLLRELMADAIERRAQPRAKPAAGAQQPE